MSDFTYIPGTPIFYVRLLIPDTVDVAPGPIFSDSEITAFLQINQMTWQSSMFYSWTAGKIQLPSCPSNFLRAAALAINAIAGSLGKLAVVQQLLDVKLDHSKAAAALQAVAQRYLDMDDNSGAFAIAEQVTTVWNWRDRFIAQIQRQSGGMPIA